MRLEYGNLRVIWPGGAVPADLGDLAGSILLLSAADLEETSVEAWQRAQPLAVFVLGLPPGPLPAGWLNMSVHGRVEVVSDGNKIIILADYLED